MHGKRIWLPLLVLLLLAAFKASFALNVMAEPTVIRVPKDYPTIQAAINSANYGDTIFVAPGIYYEHVVVNKTVLLFGEDRDTTIIDGSQTSSLVEVTANNVTICNFTIQRASVEGIILDHSFNSTVANNNVYANLFGIVLGYSSNNTIIGNNVSMNYCGIALAWSNNSIFTRNDIHDNSEGMQFQFPSCNNTVFENDIYSDFYLVGISIWAGDDNRIFHNNFINNTANSLFQAENYWDDGYPSGGNYWSDSNITDFYAGLNQVENGSDGIGDKPYVINTQNRDNYPLMGRFSSFNASADYHVYTVCNSTISNFNYDAGNRQVTFTVTGANATVGFCRVCIPHAVVPPPYAVTVDGAAPLFVNYTLYDNSTHRWIYFTYIHSSHEVTIVPEFISAALPSILLFTVLFVTIRKKTKPK